MAINKLEKITIFSLESGVKVEAQYNPKEVSFQKSVSWADQESHGSDYPGLQFTAGGAVTVSVELLFDLYESGGDVRPIIDQIMSLAKVMDSERKRPPLVTLMWGGANVLFTGPFTGVVESLSTKYTMFTASGVPCRAVATVALKQADTVGTEGSETSLQMENVNNAAELTNMASKHGMTMKQLLDANPQIENPNSYKGPVQIPVTKEVPPKPQETIPES